MTEAELGVFLESMRPELVRHAMRGKWPRDDADDMAQEAICRVWRLRGQIALDPKVLCTYLHRAVTSQGIDAARRAKMNEAMAARCQKYHAHYARTNGFAGVDAAAVVGSIPEKHREVAMFDLLGLTAKEAAFLLDVTVPAYKARLYRMQQWARAELNVESFLGL